MAKQTILEERGTGEVLYPQTIASLVKTADGGNVDEGLEKAKLALFDMQWEAAGGEVIVSGKTYGCNNVRDLTLDEALEIKERYRYIYVNISQLPRYATKLRALLPIKGLLNNAISIQEVFCNLTLTELNMTCLGFGYGFHVNNAYRAFKGCKNLTAIRGVLNVYYATASDSLAEMFSGCSALCEVRILDLRTNISFAQSEFLSLESVSYMVTNASNTSPITITLHPDAYARVTEDIFTDAAAKNITFATT